MVFKSWLYNYYRYKQKIHVRWERRSGGSTHTPHENFSLSQIFRILIKKKVGKSKYAYYICVYVLRILHISI